MSRISEYTEELSANPEGFLFMAILQDDGSYQTFKIRPDKVGAVGPTGPQGPSGDVAGPIGPAGPIGLTGNNGTDGTNGTNGVNAAFQMGVAISDELTTITAGVAKVTFRMPSAVTLVSVRASLNAGSSSGVVTVDINEAGVSILSTKLTIDSGEKTSVTAAIPAVLSDTALADDAEITVDIDTAGTAAKGLKLWLLGNFV